MGVFFAARSTPHWAQHSKSPNNNATAKPSNPTPHRKRHMQIPSALQHILPKWLASRIWHPPEEDRPFERMWRGFGTARIAIAASLLVFLGFLYLRYVGQNNFIANITCLVYLILGIGIRLTLRDYRRMQSFDFRWLLTVGLDIAIICILQTQQVSNIFSFTPLIAFPVLQAAVLGNRLAAVGSAAIVGILLLAQAWWHSRGGGGNSDQLFLQAALNSSGFLLIAFLGNQLSTRLQRQLEAAHNTRHLARTQVQVNQLVIDSMQSGVLVVDMDSMVLIHNPAAMRIITGEHHPRFEQRNMALLNLKNRPEWEPLQRLVLRCSKRQERVISTVRLRFAHADTQLKVRAYLVDQAEDGTAGSASRNAAAPDENALCVLFLEDLRETQAQMRTSKMAAMGRMSTAVAHEIRNPLAAISQANELLSEDRSTPLSEPLTRMIDDNVKRLNRIVSDILEVAHVRDADYHSPVISILETAQNSTREWIVQNNTQSRAQLHLHCEEQLVYFDAEDLRRILVNLLDNASRYASHNDGAIQVHLEAEEGEYIFLSVWSDGEPIEASLRAHFFEPFFSSESRSSGLGLYLCRELCQRHAAQIDYRRTDRGGRQGNEFFLQIKCVRAHNMNEMHTVPGSLEAESDSNSSSLL